MTRYVCVGGALFELCGCMSVSGCVCSVFDGGVHGCVCCKCVRCVHVVFAEDGALCVYGNPVGLAGRRGCEEKEQTEK